MRKRNTIDNNRHQLRKVRLCVGPPEARSLEAISLLRSVGFSVRIVPISGLSQPQLTLGSDHYNGIEQIRGLVKHVKNNTDAKSV